MIASELFILKYDLFDVYTDAHERVLVTMRYTPIMTYRLTFKQIVRMLYTQMYRTVQYLYYTGVGVHT